MPRLTPEEPQPDDVRFAHYRVERHEDGTPWVLGTGGMGVTYKAFDERLRVEVTLKVITPSRMFDPEAQALFLREARAAAKVRHPNVASVLFLGDTPGSYFYAMEYIAGEPLHTWMRARGPLPARQALDFAGQIAAGLGAIHDAHLIHRDLKPANVMAVRASSSDTGGSGEWQLKIIDFGLARAFEGEGQHDSVQTLGFRGTLRYASPEQCEERRDLDGRSDLYALGCILWEMLAGAPPFHAPTQRELLNQHVSQAPPLERIQHAPESVRGIVARLLKKDRAQRFPNATALREALTAARQRIEGGLESEGFAPPPDIDEAFHSTVSWSPPAERSRWLMPAAATALVLTGLGVGWFLRQPGRPPAALAVAAAPVAPASRKSVAVLPFLNLTGDKADDSVADGIHEDVIINLVKVRDLRIIGRSSVQAYRSGDRNLRQIAGALNVGSVVEGTVRRSGSRVRVSAGLVDASTDRTVWAESFDGDVKDLFDLQTALAKKIAASLEARLSPEETGAIERRPTQSAAALAHYQRAQELRRSMLTSNREDLGRIIAAYDAAVAEDPAFALAHAQLAVMHSEMFWYRFDVSDARKAAVKRSAETALALDSTLPEAHMAAGYLRYRIERDYAAALTEFRYAEQLRPNIPDVKFAVATACRRLGQWDEAEQAFRAAAELSPSDAGIVNEYAETLGFMHKDEESAKVLRRLLQFYPANPDVQAALARAELNRSGEWLPYRRAFARFASTIAEGDQHIGWFFLMDRDYYSLIDRFAARPDVPVRGPQYRIPSTYFLGWANHLLGNREAARDHLTRCAATLEGFISDHPKAAYERAYLAQMLALLGRAEDARQMVQQAMAARPSASDALSGPDIEVRGAVALAWIGDRDRAIELLTNALSRPGDLARTDLRLHPQWDPLRGDPRFEKLAAGK